MKNLEKGQPLSTVDTVSVENAIAKFEVGKTYYTVRTSFDGRSWKNFYKVIKRTSKTITFKEIDDNYDDDLIIKCKCADINICGFRYKNGACVDLNNPAEYIYLDDLYTQNIWASDVVKESA